MSISRSTSSCVTSLPSEPLVAPQAKSEEFGVLGSSAAIRRLRLQIRRIGPHFRTVLIRGEAGTEKESIARALHGISQSANAPFVVCDAASYDDALVHPNISAASEDAPGPVKKLPRGTLFLEEISEMPFEAQGRLLRVLERHDSVQNRTDTSQRIDLRLIASTCEDLRILVSTGRFRQELYQRLATVEITVPPLRERMEDFPDLMRYFLDQFALIDGNILEVTDDAMERMRQYSWPGNVSELEGVLQNGVQLGSGALELHHLPVLAGQTGEEQSMTGANESVRLQDVVEQHVLRVLKDCGGNKLRTAEMLGISRSTLYRMLDTGAAAKIICGEI